MFLSINLWRVMKGEHGEFIEIRILIESKNRILITNRILILIIQITILNNDRTRYE